MHHNIYIIIITIIIIITQVNAEDMKGEATPLYYAALAGSEPAVDLLLLYGGDAQNSNSGEKVEHTICDFIMLQCMQKTLFMLILIFINDSLFGQIADVIRRNLPSFDLARINKVSLGSQFQR